MRLPKWLGTYEPGLGWQIPEWLRVVLWPLAFVGLALLLVGEAVMGLLWIARKLKGK